MRRFHFITIYTFLIAVFLLPESYTQSLQSDIRKLSEGSDLIVTGKVIEQKSQWNSDKSKIYTNVTIQVDEFLKGDNSQSRIVIKNPGGEVGNVGETYSHMPTFKNEEDVLVFVKRSNKDQSLIVFQGDAGKMTLYENNKTGEKITAQNIKVSEMKNKIRNYVENK